MSYFHEKTVWIAGGIGSTVAFVTEHTDISFTILIGMMLIDVLSGLAKGIHSKRLKSSIGHLGLMKKAGILLAVAMGYMLDLLVNDGRPVFSVMMVWVSIGNEGLSILENLSAMDVKAVPKSVKNVLAQMSDNGKEIQAQKDGFVTVPVSEHSAQTGKEVAKHSEPVKVDEDTEVDVKKPTPSDVSEDEEVIHVSDSEQDKMHESAKNEKGFK